MCRTKVAAIIIAICFVGIVNIFASESINFNLQQNAIISSSIQTNSFSYTLNPGIIGEHFGGKTESANFSSFVGYTPKAGITHTYTTYININGTIDDVSADSVAASYEIDGIIHEFPGQIINNVFLIEDVLVHEGENIIALTCWDKVGHSTTKNFTIYFDPIPPSRPTVILNPLTEDSTQQILGTKEEHTSLWIGQQEMIFSDYPESDTNLKHGIENWIIEYVLEEGINSLEIYCKDRAGNRSSALDKQIIRDSIAGDIRIIEPENGLFLNQEYITVRGTYEENSPSIEVNGVSAELIDETNFVAEYVPVNIEPDIIDGPHTIQVTLTSPLLHTNYDSVDITLDRVGPDIAQVSLDDFIRFYNDETIDFSVAEVYDEFYEYHEFRFLMGGEIIQDWSLESSSDYQIPQDLFGRKSAYFEVRDSAGNSDSIQSDIFILKRPVLP